MFSSDIKTHFLQPSKDIKNNQIEFKIPAGMVLVSPPRLLELGGTAATAGEYPRTAGVMSIVDSIRILDGQTELENIGLVPQLTAFKNMNCTNDKAISEVNPSYGCRIGLSKERDEFIRPTFTVENFELKTAATDVDNARLMCNMGRYSGFFSSGMVSTEKHSHLRIIFKLNKGKYTTVNDWVENTKPVLACDLTDNEETLKKVNSMDSRTYITMEHDRQHLAAIGANSSSRVRMNNFINKTVNRFFIQTEATTGSGDDLLASFSLPDSTVQVYVNNDNLYPDSGVKQAMRTAFLCDAWGDLLADFSLQNYKSPASGAAGDNSNDLGFIDELPLVGLVDYTGGEVMRKVNSLEVQLERKYSSDASGVLDNQAIYLNCFGEVIKSIVYTPSGYSMVYV